MNMGLVMNLAITSEKFETIIRNVSISEDEFQFDMDDLSIYYNDTESVPWYNFEGFKKEDYFEFQDKIADVCYKIQQSLREVGNDETKQTNRKSTSNTKGIR